VARRARARANAETVQWSRVVADCTACLKVELDWELWYLRGVAYRELKRQELALADLTRALARGGDGLAVRRERAAVAFDLKKWDLAVADCTEIARRSPKDVANHLLLSRALIDLGKFDEAVASLRRVVALDPNNAPAHGHLGTALRGLGRFDEALKSYRRCLVLTSPVYPERADWQRLAVETGRLLALVPRLPAFLSGSAKPASAAEALDLAQACRCTQRHAAAVRFYGWAFASKPSLADDPKASHCYHAACSAALAGSGKGADAAQLDDMERARLRRQALTWLRGHMTLRVKRWGNPADRAILQGMVRYWQTDPQLASLRDPAAVAKLPADEQEACKKLWADAAALLKQAEAKAP
jgi:tetratricopeptide (TPR) repeat protein